MITTGESLSDSVGASDIPLASVRCELAHLSFRAEEERVVFTYFTGSGVRDRIVDRLISMFKLYEYTAC